MQPSSVELVSARSSSVSLRHDYEVVDEDRSIAQELLQGGPSDRSFLARNPISLQGIERVQSRNPDIVTSSHQNDRARRAHQTSNTWTSSDGEILSDQDEVDDRAVFFEEYNRLAKKHGVRVMNENWEKNNDELNNLSPKTGWLRRILRRTSSSQSVKTKPEKQLKHRRSISDLSIRLKLKREKLKDKDLQELVRLCGASMIYLPAEYAPASLLVPTCFRATAQYLIQYGTSTRGIFRIPGSHTNVSALYNHYCSTDEYGQVISGTVRCPTLPDHIKCDVHDVASAFKRFLSGLPGGILGSLQLLDAFISIQSQLAGQAELTRTKQSKVRARLIALAVATLRSQYRRELICAVFGLLCMIGRTAETAQREDARGRPLPTSDLMGYGPLGIVFGPLLVGDLLEDYTMRLADPHRGLVLLPISPPKSRKERQKKSKSGENGNAFSTHVDKIRVVNGITEMLITHWRDVVRHTRNLSALKNVASMKSLAVKGTRQQILRPSASESFALRKPPDWTEFKAPLNRRERSESPTPAQRMINIPKISNETTDSLIVRKQRSGPRPMSSQRLSGARSMNILSPTLEEGSREDPIGSAIQEIIKTISPDPTDTSTSDLHELHGTTKTINTDIGIREEIHTVISSISDSNLQPEFPIRNEINHDSSEPHLASRSSPTRPPPTPHRLDRPPTPAVAYSTPVLVSAPPAAKDHTSSSNQITSKQKSDFNDLEKPLHIEIPETINPRVAISNLGFSFKDLFLDDSTFQRFDDIVGTEKQMPSSILPAAREPTWNSGPPLPKQENRGMELLVLPEPSFKQVKNLRRIGVSEPGLLQPVSPSKSVRRISRSLYEDPSRKRNLIDWSKLPFQRDPLAQVSVEKDTASLVCLAQAMHVCDDIVDSLDDRIRMMSIARGDAASDSRLTPTRLQDSPKVKNVLRKVIPVENPGRAVTSKMNSKRENRSSIVGFFQKDKSASGSEFEGHTPQKKLGIFGTTQQEDHRNGSSRRSILVNNKLESKNTDHLTAQQSNSASLQFEIPTHPSPTERMQQKGGIAIPGNRSSSQLVNCLVVQASGSPTKISALVARFNTNSAPLLPTNVSPTKTPVNSSLGYHRHRPNSPGESLVAPYTTNTPSPTKSQKSNKSDKTPNLSRSPESREKAPKNGIFTDSNSAEHVICGKSLTPKRILRMSLNDPTPLRSTPRALNTGDSPSAEPSPRSSVVSKAQTIRMSIEERTKGRLGQQQEVSSSKGFQSRQSAETELSLCSYTKGLPIPTFFEDSFTSLQPLDLVERSSPSPKLSSDPTATTHKQSLYTTTVTSTSLSRTSPVPSSLNCMQIHSLSPKLLLTGWEKIRSASPVESLIDVPAFDGPGSIDDTTQQNPRSSKELIVPTLSVTRASFSGHESNLADFVHPDSPLADLFTSSSSEVSDRRRQNLLINQMRNLRRQIMDMEGEIRYLRSKVGTLRTVDAQRIEELNRGRKEAEMWKKRAETAESDLEALNARILSRHSHKELVGKLPGSWASSSESSEGVPSTQHETIQVATKTLGSSNHSIHGRNSSQKDKFGMLKEWSSEASTGTVLRDVMRDIDGTDGTGGFSVKTT